MEMNFIRKHALELAAKGVERPAARLFSNPAGDFGSMVNERVNVFLVPPCPFPSRPHPEKQQIAIKKESGAKKKEG